MGVKPLKPCGSAPLSVKCTPKVLYPTFGVYFKGGAVHSGNALKAVRRHASPPSRIAAMGVQKVHTHYGNRWRVVELPCPN